MIKDKSIVLTQDGLSLNIYVIEKHLRFSEFQQVYFPILIERLIKRL
jgi:hypothetical protein